MTDTSHRFLLKVWREPGTQANWHATLRDASDGAVHHFKATEALIEYLASLDEVAAPEKHAQEESR